MDASNKSEELTPTEEFEKKYGNQPWVCPKGQEWYYIDSKAPDDQVSALRSAVLHPLMGLLGSRVTEDPTYGRYTLPFSPREKLIRDNPSYTCWDARVFLDESRRPVEEKTNSWIWYQVWWDEKASQRTGAVIDICLCHGIAEYSGRWAAHAKRLLDAGHGRSTGLHCYLNDLNDLAHAIQVVLIDVIKHDFSAGKAQRSVFILGQSMGGFTAVLYVLLYKTPTVSVPVISVKAPTPKVLGILALCPMLAISEATLPNPAVTVFAKIVKLFLGRLPLIEGYKGKATEDRFLDDEFKADPQTYHGNVRIATGLAILKALLFTDRYMAEITLPFRVMHGDCDRVTSVEGSKRFFQVAKSVDKEIRVYSRTEHIMLRVGRDESDDQKRQEILSEMIDWIERIRKTYT
ncbi:hypothetical protein CROQUDRAFT_653436 [Cronartium quercuum f. sp. fusiforme G11]|uniref:Serine aminopeptidase S33 domain-containing protein n=1 Tax=Cronartium quercuum f. sp. fusiforme G11 TaxID=708437 RepID=A0A9P6NM31_9BASI|nr:hypothetical protein CROQUDRAFT_653436 [Cronartium quercuum f. sp. fusiforme G11]